MESFKEFEDLITITDDMRNIISVNVPLKYADEVKAIAKQRAETHKNHRSRTVWNPQSEMLGVIGEFAFELLTGFKMDRSIQKKGDTYDFLINDHAIDVKSSSNGHYLRVKVKNFHPVSNFIYVLAKTQVAPEAASADFLGWINGLHMSKYCVEECLYQSPCYKISKAYLAPMFSLKKVLNIEYQL
jgi:hypothetical protein